MYFFFSSPLRIGIGFGLLGILFTIIGITRGNVPPNPASIGMALLIGAGSWFVVSWAVATAAFDVEKDIARDVAREIATNEPLDEKKT